MENSQPVSPQYQTPEPIHVKHSQALPLVAGLVFLLVGAAAVIGYFVGANNQRTVITEQPEVMQPQPTQSIPEGVICTMDAKICPDGSSVGRQGPNCEFAECPQSTQLTEIKEVYKGRLNAMTLSYPPSYTAEIADVISGGKMTEQVVFTNHDATSRLKSFEIRIDDTIKELPEYPYDNPPTGEYELDGVKGIYLELPDGYGDGGHYVPRPEAYVFFINNDRQYAFSFYGVSNINDPLVQEILNGFTFK